ncbi:MAG: metallophosphoesterase [Anaerolineaceae bacterium]|nr:metallophosphoesterase [Anaerolineaceae bacterium]
MNCCSKPRGFFLILAVVCGLLILLTGCKPALTQTITPPPVKLSTVTYTIEATNSPTLTATASPHPTASPSPAPTRLTSDLTLSDVSYRLPLTIRHVTENSVVFFFELSQPSVGSITLQPVDLTLPTITTAFDADSARHLITIEGLRPAASYEIILTLNENGQLTQPSFQSRAWTPMQVHTRSENQHSFRIGVIGDASFGDSATADLIKRMAQADLNFVLNLGDVVDETEFGVDPFESYAEKFFAPFEPLLHQMPVYTVPGNHDYDADLRYDDQPFYAYAFPPFSDDDPETDDDSFAGQFAVLPIGDLQILLLDAMTIFGLPGRDAQELWLSERLTDDGYRAAIPVFHVSPYSSSVVHPQDSTFTRAVWVPQFEMAGNVPLVLSGHFHHYERLLVNDITYLVSGGGSSILYAAGPYLPESQVYTRQTHFVLLEINEDSLQVSAISVDGTLLDEYSLGVDEIKE